MGEPKWVDGYLMSDSDMTDHDYWLGETECVERRCPVCGCRNIRQTDEDSDDFDTIINGYHCEGCGSDFSYTYWAKVVVVRNDGRFNKED